MQKKEGFIRTFPNCYGPSSSVSNPVAGKRTAGTEIQIAS